MKMTLLFFIFLKAFVAESAQLQLSPAESLLERDFLTSPGAVSALPQTTLLYHYFNPAMQGNQLWPTYQTPESRSGPQGQTHLDLSLLAGAFWNMNYHDTNLVNAGPGMYLATEPLVSESFGRSSYAMSFPEGTQTLDVSDPTWKNVSKVKVSKETFKALISEGIVTSATISKYGMGGGYFTRITMQYIAAVGNEKLRESVSKIFERNHIVLVQFSWQPTKLKVICKKASSSAFVYIGSAPTGSVTSNVAAVVSADLVEHSVFMSQYQVSQYTAAESKLIQLVRDFKAALVANSAASLNPDELAEIKQLSFSCQ